MHAKKYINVPLTPHSTVLLEKLTGLSASQEISHILWNPKVRNRIHECLPPVSILSQLDLFHTPTSHYLKIHLNIILYVWVSQVVSFPQVSPPKPSLSHACYMPCPSHLDLITRTIFGEQYRSLSSSLCSFLHSPVTSSLLGPNILLNTLFSNTLSLRSSFNISDQVSHPY